MLRALFCSLLFVSCSVVSRYDIPDKTVCKNRVFIRSSYDPSTVSLPRAAMMPVIVDKGVRVEGDWIRYLSASLAQRLLEDGVFPVLEILDRWEPIVRDEFFTGNHVTLKLARDLGLDVLVLAYYKPVGRADEIYLKVLDVRRNITNFYGKSLIYSKLPWYKALLEEGDIYKRDLSMRDITQRLVDCAVKAFDEPDI